MNVQALTGWDWFVLGLFALSVGAGVWKGLVRTVFGLAAWLVAFVGAPLAAPALITATGMQAHPWVVLVAVFVLLLVSVRAMGVLVARGLGKAGLGGADRAFGGLLGAARAIVFLALAAVFARSVGLDAGWRQSLTGPLLEHLYQWVEPHLPERASGVRET